MDPKLIVEEAVRLFMDSANRKQIDLKCLVDRDVPRHLRGDPYRLRQILTNLIGNALKFTETGEVTITARRHEHSEQGLMLFFEVRDTGRGMAPDMQARVFDAFWQEDGSPTREYGGTGLGLAIARQLVEMMGGEIGLESELGKGSRFWFTVRLDEEAEGTLSEVMRPLVSSDVSEDSEQGDDAGSRSSLEGRILLAEDDRLNQEVAAQMLSYLGCEVEVVDTGQKAVETAATHSYDLILMDCRMPEMSGYEAARQIRHKEQTLGSAKSRIPIIALTANAIQGDRERCLAAGMDDHLGKPFTMDALRGVLVPWLRNRKVGPRTVLYIEDDPVLVELVRTIVLTRSNFTFLFAHRAEPRIALARTHCPDLILTQKPLWKNALVVADLPGISCAGGDPVLGAGRQSLLGSCRRCRRSRGRCFVLLSGHGDLRLVPPEGRGAYESAIE